MQIGAILTLAASNSNESGTHESLNDGARKRRQFLSNVPNPKLDLLGKSLLDRTADKLRQSGVKTTTVIAEGPTLTQLARSFVSSDAGATWDRAVAESVREGVQTLILLRAGAYTDLDFEEVLPFHGEQRATLTQVYAPDGSLDIAVVDAKSHAGGFAHAGQDERGCPTRSFAHDDRAARKLAQTLGALIPKQERFLYDGYVNRLRKPQDFRRLTEDALCGKCRLRPAGSEVGDGVWLGAGAQIDESCVIEGPVYIGAGTRIGAGCTIIGGSAIERDCEIDFGTTVEQSWILQQTYIGLSLTVRHSIVSNQKMFHLDRKAEIAITDSSLIRATKSLAFTQQGHQGGIVKNKLQIAS